MSAHKVISELTEAKNAQGFLFAFTAGIPTASIAGYSKGAIASDTTNGKLYINAGSATSASWVVVGGQS